MNAQAASLQRGRTWIGRPLAVAAVATAFAVGVIVGRQPILEAVEGGRAALTVPGSAAMTPARVAERDGLIEFRAGERSLEAPVAGRAERDALVVFRAAERASAAAIEPATAERDGLTEFRAGERSLEAPVAGRAERDALVVFRAAERASWADGKQP
jgi:hypothetical protein